MFVRAIGILAAVGFSALAAFPANAADIEVKMLNKGEAGPMVFEPAYIKANPGDNIIFLPTDKGHNVESVKDMLPEGVEKFKSKMNEAYTLTVTEEGAYFVKCTPHYTMGMVALIVVGDNPSNLDAIVSAKKPKAVQKRLENAIASGK